jgi:hypothetical protein
MVTRGGIIVMAFAFAVPAALATVSVCWLPGWLEDHGDVGAVRAAAVRYLAATGHVTVVRGNAHASGNDGVWWARVRLDETDELAMLAHLRAFPRVHPAWSYAVEPEHPRLASLGVAVPSWWTIRPNAHTLMLGNGVTVFMAVRADAPNEWDIMELTR